MFVKKRKGNVFYDIVKSVNRIAEKANNNNGHFFCAIPLLKRAHGPLQIKNNYNRHMQSKQTNIYATSRTHGHVSRLDRVVCPVEKMGLDSAFKRRGSVRRTDVKGE